MKRYTRRPLHLSMFIDDPSDPLNAWGVGELAVARDSCRRWANRGAPPTTLLATSRRTSHTNRRSSAAKKARPGACSGAGCYRARRPSKAARPSPRWRLRLTGIDGLISQAIRLKAAGPAISGVLSCAARRTSDRPGSADHHQFSHPASSRCPRRRIHWETSAVTLALRRHCERRLRGQ